MSLDRRGFLLAIALLATACDYVWDVANRGSTNTDVAAILRSHGMPALIYDHRCSGSQAYIALARELIAGDALLDGRLVRVAAQELDLDAGRDYHVVYPETLRDDPAVRAFCDWLHAEIAALQQRLNETRTPG